MQCRIDAFGSVETMTTRSKVKGGATTGGKVVGGGDNARGVGAGAGAVLTEETVKALENRTADECMRSFNAKILLLVKNLVDKFPSDAKIWRAKERITMGIRLNPEFVVNTVGGYLVQYATEIAEKNEKFFLENKYDAELKNGTKEEKVDLVMYIMPKVKDAWKTISTREREDYFEMVSNLLFDYSDFKLAPKAARNVSRG